MAKKYVTEIGLLILRNLEMKKLLIGTLLLTTTVSAFSSCKVGYLNIEGGDTRVYEVLKDDFLGINDIEFIFAGRSMNTHSDSHIYLVSEYKRLKSSKNKQIDSFDMKVYSSDLKVLGTFSNVGKVQTPENKQAKYQPQQGESKPLGYHLERLEWAFGPKSKVKLNRHSISRVLNLINSECLKF